MPELQQTELSQVIHAQGRLPQSPGSKRRLEAAKVASALAKQPRQRKREMAPADYGRLKSELNQMGHTNPKYNPPKSGKPLWYWQPRGNDGHMIGKQIEIIDPADTRTLAGPLWIMGETASGTGWELSDSTIVWKNREGKTWHVSESGTSIDLSASANAAPICQFRQKPTTRTQQRRRPSLPSLREKKGDPLDHVSQGKIPQRLQRSSSSCGLSRNCTTVV